MSSPTPPSGDRLVYSEWGNQTEPAAESAVDVSPQQHRLQIQRERGGRGGKTVTVIKGWQLTSASLQKMAKHLKTQCGSGGSIQGQTIEIQGDHRHRLVELLKGLGYPVKLSGG
ncbi:MAG: translation initiation factor [Cyanobacteriota bacterium]|nr:translation initiation factor [Cyanobacteriota bacterium]